jgi:hypothetical protein
MKYVGIILTLLLIGCSEEKKNTHSKPHTVAHTERSNSQPLEVKAADDEVQANFDLQAVLSIVKESGSAKEIEQKVNNGDVNNLDMNDDGDVDFVKVTEFNNPVSNEHGFSFTVHVTPEEEQEVASISVKKNDEGKAVFTARGSEAVYGNNDTYYRTTSVLTTLLLWSYLTTPHQSYRPLYDYNHKPAYYKPYRRVAYSKYRNRTSKYRSGSKVYKMKPSGISKYKKYRKTSKLKNPNKGKKSNRYSINKKKRRSLSQPVKTQKKFSARDTNKPIPVAKAFGKKDKKAVTTTAAVTSTKKSGFGGSNVKNKRSSPTRKVRVDGSYNSNNKKTYTPKKRKTNFGSSPSTKKVTKKKKAVRKKATRKNSSNRRSSKKRK